MTSAIAKIAADHWMEQWYWLSQVFAAGMQLVLVGVAVWAGLAAYRQFNAFRLFELLKCAQAEDFRLARRSVIRSIGSSEAAEWWKDPELEAVASDCCAHYDILGRMLIYNSSGGTARFFAEHWADSIIRTHDILSSFIEMRRQAGGNDCRGYDWLYKEAKKFKSNIGTPWPPTGLAK